MNLQEPEALGSIDPVELEIVIETGPWRGLRKPLRPNPPREVLLGRDAEKCHVPIHPSHASVSHKHAAIEERSAGFILRCLGKGGVRVNEQPALGPGDTTAIRDGDRIWLGAEDGVRLTLRGAPARTGRDAPTMVITPQTVVSRAPLTTNTLQEQLAQVRASYLQLKDMYRELEQENTALKQQPAGAGPIISSGSSADIETLDLGQASHWLDCCRKQIQEARRMLQGIVEPGAVQARSALSGSLDALAQLSAMLSR